MTIKNLRLALQLNNTNVNTEINLIIAYINQFATNQKILHYEINKRFDSVETDLNQLDTTLTYQISLLDTRLTSRINTLADDYGLHKADTDIHITSAERDKWNATSQYTDGALKEHTENLVIHVTQDDKDLWNATLQNAKDYAKALFDRLTSFEIIKCQELPTEDIKEMTIYFLQIDPEQDDLYEEYMYIDGTWEKIGNTRIDLSDYVTKAMLQSAVDTLNNTITSKETALNNTIANTETAIKGLISDLENKHDSDIQDITDALGNTNQDIQDLSDNLNQKIDTLETKHDQELDALSDKHDEDIASLSDSIRALSDSHDQDIQTLTDAIQNLSDAHDQDIQNINDTHYTKTEVDGLFQDVETEIASVHTHDNKDVLDKLSADNKGRLQYNEEVVGDYFTEEDLTELLNFLWRNPVAYISADNKEIITKDGYVFKAKEGGS